MENKSSYFEKYHDFLYKRKMLNNNKLLEEKSNNFNRKNNLEIVNKTEPVFNLNIKNIEKRNDSDSGCLSSLRRQFNSKNKPITSQNLETNYKTFYTNDSPSSIKKIKANNSSSNNVKDRKSDIRQKSNINNTKIENIINDYKNNNIINNLFFDKNIIKNKNKIKYRALSTSNLNKNKQKIYSNYNIKKINFDKDKNLFNYKKNNNLNNFLSNSNLSKKKINNNNKKNNSLDKSNLNFTFDSQSLNKELDHILNSYDFKNINNDINEINIDDKSIKIHFRNLLYLVKELQAKNDLLKKEIRIKNNLISTLENQMNNKKIRIAKNLNNSILQEYNDNILVDNNRLKSEILNLEKKLENQKIYYEDLINDYKVKLNEQKNKNNIMNNNLQNIENKYKFSNNKIIDMKDELKDVTLMKAKLQDINEKYGVINIEQQKKIENLENQLKVLLTLVKNLFNQENNILYPMRTKLFYEISNIGKDK